MELLTATELFPVTEIELVYRNKVKAKDRPKVKNAENAALLFLTNWDLDKIEIVEQFKMLLLNKANACLGIVELSTGGLTSTIADPRIVFGMALKACATKIMLAHNHPSCNLEPSKADLALTRRMEEAGSILNIEVLDHLIVCPYGYYSLANNQLMSLTY